MDEVGGRYHQPSADITLERLYMGTEGESYLITKLSGKRTEI